MFFYSFSSWFIERTGVDNLILILLSQGRGQREAQLVMTPVKYPGMVLISAIGENYKKKLERYCSGE